MIILLSIAYAIVAFPVGLVAGIRQARHNARLAPSEFEYEDGPFPPLGTALGGGLCWLPWLAAYALFRLCCAANVLLERAAATDKIANPAKLEALERETLEPSMRHYADRRFEYREGGNV